MSRTLKHRHTDFGATNGKEFRKLSPPCLSASQNAVGDEEQIRSKLAEKENEKNFHVQEPIWPYMDNGFSQRFMVCTHQQTLERWRISLRLCIFSHLKLLPHYGL